MLTVTVNNNAKTSLATIATAINNYAEASGLKPFSATVATAGNFNSRQSGHGLCTGRGRSLRH